MRAHTHGGGDRAEQQRGPTGTGRDIPAPISSNIHRCRFRCHRIPIFDPPCPISTAILPAVHARTRSHVETSHVRHRDADTLTTTATMRNRVHSCVFREHIYECKYICTVECSHFCTYDIDTAEHPPGPFVEPVVSRTATDHYRYLRSQTFEPAGHRSQRRRRPTWAGSSKCPATAVPDNHARPADDNSTHLDSLGCRAPRTGIPYK